MSNRILSSLLAAVLILSLAACGGGGGGTSSALPAKSGGPGTSGNPTSNAVMTITIPAKLGTSGNKRRPQWVSAAAMGIDVGVLQNGFNAGDTQISVAPGAPNCTPGSGQRTCTVSFGIVPGLDKLVITLEDEVPPFDSNVGSLAQASVVQSVSPGVTANFNVTLNGIVGFLDFNASGPNNTPATSFVSGTAGSNPTQWTAYDIDQEAIPGPYANPVQLFTDDTTHGLNVSPTTLTANTAGTIAYNGNPSTASSSLSTCDLSVFLYLCFSIDGEQDIYVNPPSGSPYVSDAGSANVVAFSNNGIFGNQSPIRNLGVSHAAGIAMRSGGFGTWVAIPGSSQARRFNPGVSITSPVELGGGPKLSDTRMKNMAGAAFIQNRPYFADPVNNVVYQGTNIPCPPCAWSLNTLTAPGVNTPLGLAGFGTTLYVMNTGNNSITEYTVSSASTTATLLRTVTSTSLVTPKGIAVDSAGNSFVADTGAAGGPKVFIFSAGAAGATAPINTISTGFASIFGVAVDSTGAVWVSGMNAAGPALAKFTSSTPPSAPYTLAGTISGTNTGLSNPTYLAVSP